MPRNPYAIPVHELIDAVRVPADEQVVEQPELRPLHDGWTGPGPYADGMGGDADGE